MKGQPHTLRASPGIRPGSSAWKNTTITKIVSIRKSLRPIKHCTVESVGELPDMTRFRFMAAAILFTLGFTGGCHCIERTYQSQACCDSWDPVLGSCDVCGLCSGGCEGRTPVQAIKHHVSCSSGCGEVYWGEWISDPPSPCDPCDNWGQWVGPRPCPPNCWETLASGWCNFWGYRQRACGGCTSGCNLCSATVKGHSVTPPHGVKILESPETDTPYLEEDDPLPPIPDAPEQASRRPRQQRPVDRRFQLRSVRLAR